MIPQSDANKQSAAETIKRLFSQLPDKQRIDQIICSITLAFHSMGLEDDAL